MPASSILDEKPYVEIDLSTLPAARGSWRYKLSVRTADKDLHFEDEIEVSPGPVDLEIMALAITMSMIECKFKVDIVDKTKIRVYGRVYNDKLIPATEGVVESKNLKPKELPIIKNPPKA